MSLLSWQGRIHQTPGRSSKTSPEKEIEKGTKAMRTASRKWN
jgi:hypothetical protein